MTIQFDRRIDQKTLSSHNPAEVWTQWRGNEETWLFLSPHDDDIACGVGLTFLAGLQCGIKTYAAVVSNGRMGYCTPDQRRTIADVRSRETKDSFQFYGLPEDHLFQFDYDDGSLTQESGRRFATAPNGSNVIGGAVGLQNTLTWLFRKVRPNRIFLPNRLDLHPDHKAVALESMISIFHAQGAIWPELGPPIKEIPTLYEYATYSNFISPPTMRIRVDDDLVEKRLEGLALFKSQLQIDLIVQGLRKAGGTEYLLEVAFEVFRPEQYRDLFQTAQ